MRSRLIFLGLLTLTLAACGGGEVVDPGNSSTTTTSNEKASSNKDDYPVFPDADVGADPAVSAEQGGKGFTGQGWETNTGFDLIGDPRAAKGGTLHDALLPGAPPWRRPKSSGQFWFTATTLGSAT